jgi:hypothetical protein
MAVTSEQIVDFLLANPGMSDAQIVAAMEQYGISPAQMAGAVGIPEGQIASRVAATVQPGQTVTLGDTIVQPVHETVGSGQDQQIGGIQNVITYKVGENQTGGGYNQYSASGVLERTGTQEKVDTSLGGAVKQLVQNPGFQIGALALGANALMGGGAGLFGGTGAVGSDLAGLSGIPAGVGALTAAESAALYGTSGLAAGGITAAGTGTAGLMGTGTGLTTAGAGGLGGATGAAGLGGSLGAGLTTAGAGGLGGAAGAAGLGGLGTGLTTAGGLAGANTLLGGSTLGSTLGGLTTGVVGSTLGSTLGSTVGSTLGSTLANTATSTLGKGLTSGSLANLFSGGLGTAGSLLQMQQSKEAALAAQQRIDAETAAAKQSAAFRPVGMTTRFGTSQFGFDPTTGQMTSAGYTLSPEAKAQQDRFVTLSNQGLTQAEGAQAQFAPLQTGAQNLFSLGNQYISQTPQSVAENYLKQQMALLQPGRETELANLQNRLQQQGRGGLAVAQGGTMGATTPELQALYNARAQQEAVLAANAQQAGQQQVLYGAGLLGQGANAMGSYYGGQQQAYTPYTTALGQVQNLETLGQQPFNMSNALAQQTSTAGARQGQLGLTGAQLSTNLATSANATANPYAQALMAAGNPSSMFGQAIGNVASGLFGSTPATSGFSYGQYGTGIDPSTGEYFGSLYF